MCSKIGFLLLLCVVASYGCEDFLESINLTAHLTYFQDERIPLTTAYENARTYIQESFESWGLTVTLNNFTTNVSKGSANEAKSVYGQNIIGMTNIYRGGPVLVIGADYGTVSTDQADCDDKNGYVSLRDNGVGVAIMLEVARNLNDLNQELWNNLESDDPDDEDDDECFPYSNSYINSTFIFVAFDINNRKYVPTGGSGKPGSFFFVQWVQDLVDEYDLDFRGAIILSSISEFNTDEGSQDLPDDFCNLFPDSYNSIKDSGWKGNFLAMISRNDECTHVLKKAFVEAFAMTSDYCFEDMALSLNASISTQSMRILSQHSQTPFWYANPPLPAILLTDTGELRDAADAACSLNDFWTDTREDFANSVTDATFRMAMGIEFAGASRLSPTAANMVVLLLTTFIVAVQTKLFFVM